MTSRRPCRDDVGGVEQPPAWVRCHKTEREGGVAMPSKADEKSRSGRSRRELIAGAAGAVGVLAAQAGARVPAANATPGRAIIAGRGNNEPSCARMTNHSA